MAPRFELEDEGEFARFVEFEPADVSPLRLRVTLADEPAMVADLVALAFDVRFFPRVAYMIGGG